MKRVGTAGLLVIALAAGYFLLHRRNTNKASVDVVSETARSPGKADPQGPPIRPSTVIRLTNGSSERKQIADRIATARSRATPRPSLSADIPSSYGYPQVVSGSDSMGSPETVLVQMQAAMKQVGEYVKECAKKSKISGFKADLSLNGDPDVGTLIDASALTGLDGGSVPMDLDICVRDIMQTLELPPMATGTQFKVNYEFGFD